MEGESADVATESVDLVCATLVLCTVADPRAVMREVRRMLRPGGRFVCIEHVTAPRDSAAARLQRAIRKPWRWLFEGCNLINDTEVVLRSAGFRDVEVKPLELSTMFVPIRYQIAAICTA